MFRDEDEIADENPLVIRAMGKGGGRREALED